MAVIAFDVFLGKDNIQELVLLRPEAQGGTPITDLSQYTRMAFTVGGVTVDSSTAPTLITWSDVETRTIVVDYEDTAFTGDVVKLILGAALETGGVTAGKYANCCLTVYDATHPTGAIYSNSFTVTVITPCG